MLGSTAIGPVAPKALAPEPGPPPAFNRLAVLQEHFAKVEVVRALDRELGKDSLPDVNDSPETLAKHRARLMALQDVARLTQLLQAA